MLNYIKKIHRYGLKQSLARIPSFIYHRKQKLQTHLAFWHKIVPKLSSKTIDKLLNSPCKTIFKSFLLQQQIPTFWKDQQERERELRRIQNKEAILLGQTVSLNHPNLWFIDPIHRTNLLLDQSANQNLPCGPTLSFSLAQKNGADIRLAWELGRLQWLSKRATLLLNATADEKNIFATSIKTSVADWSAKNPYLHGPHWYNGMEVAIRAINLIYQYQILDESKLLAREEKELWLQMLHQHKAFIEKHWEHGPTPNNHYLTDLVGYVHLLLFFNASEKTLQSWISKTVDAFVQQLLPDGWAYEGSTAYHKLDTELLLHLHLLAQQTSSAHKKQINTWLTTALENLSLLQNSLGKIPSIGDDDSGTILTGINAYKAVNSTPITHFPSMGLTLINHFDVACTIRHATYEPNQPTGHFHRDDLSITLTKQGIPLFVDPGSFLYTGAPDQRRHFRSFSAHNGLFCTDELLIDRQTPLFELPKQPWSEQPIIIQNPNEIKIVSKRPLYCAPGFIVRTLKVTDESLLIKDTLFSPHSHDLRLSFILAPEITIEVVDEGFLLKKENLNIALFKNTGIVSIEDSWISSTFGGKKECLKLVVTKIQSSAEVKLLFSMKSIQ